MIGALVVVFYGLIALIGAISAFIFINAFSSRI